jgi:hypothetical protein
VLFEERKEKFVSPEIKVGALPIQNKDNRYLKQKCCINKSANSFEALLPS